MTRRVRKLLWPFQKWDPNLLVGFDTSDDAGIYKLTEEIAIINTADYITPPVNDPFIFGQMLQPIQSVMFMQWAAGPSHA